MAEIRHIFRQISPEMPFSTVATPVRAAHTAAFTREATLGRFRRPAPLFWHHAG